MLCPGTPGWGRADFPQGERNCQIWPEGGAAAAAERPPPRPLLNLAVETAPGSRTQSREPRGCGGQRRPKMPLLDTQPWLLPDGAAQDTSSPSQVSCSCQWGGGEAEVATLDQGLLSPPLCCTPPSKTVRDAQDRKRGPPTPHLPPFPASWPASAQPYSSAHPAQGLPPWLPRHSRVGHDRAPGEPQPQGQAEPGLPQAPSTADPHRGRRPTSPPAPFSLWHSKRAPCWCRD